MKAIHGPIFRAIVALAVGALLIKYRQDALHWMTVAIGALFFLSGAVSCVSYWLERKRMQKIIDSYSADSGLPRPRMPFLPIVGLGSLILGIILTFIPDTFITSVAYILSAILILGGMNQLISLGQARRYSSIPLFYWLLPLITLIVGLYILIHPISTMSAPFVVIGWCMIFYGVVELLDAIKIFQLRRAFEKTEESKLRETMQQAPDDIEDAVIIDEEK